MYSFPNLEPVHCSMSGSNCCSFTWIQIPKEAAKMFWYSHLFKNFGQFVVINTVKGFSVVNEAEIDAFLEFSCIAYDPRMLAIWSLIPLPFLNPAWTSGSSRFTYCWSLAWRIFSLTLLVCEMNVIVWSFEHSLALPFLGDWNENWPFPVLATAEFSKFAGVSSTALSQHHLLGFEIAQLEFHHLH